MKIPVSKLVHGVEYPLWLIEVLRCPDGIYGIVVAREPKTVQERVPQPLSLTQIIIDEKWIKEETTPVVVETAVIKEKKVLNEEVKPKTTKSTTTKKTTSTTTKKKSE